MRCGQYTRGGGASCRVAAGVCAEHGFLHRGARVKYTGLLKAHRDVRTTDLDQHFFPDLDSVMKGHGLTQLKFMGEIAVIFIGSAGTVNETQLLHKSCECQYVEH